MVFKAVGHEEYIRKRFLRRVNPWAGFAVRILTLKTPEGEVLRLRVLDGFPEGERWFLLLLEAGEEGLVLILEELEDGEYAVPADQEVNRLFRRFKQRNLNRFRLLNESESKQTEKEN